MTQHLNSVLRCVAPAALVLGVACGTPPPPAPQERDVVADADALAHQVLIVDTHIDVPYRLTEKMEDISQRTDGGHFDLVRARQGGLDAAFMSIYIPASYQETGGAKELADQLIDLVEGLAEKTPDGFTVARSPAEVRAAADSGLVALPMGIENGAAVEDDLGNLQHFFERGVRYITLTHGKANQICDSSYDPEHKWNGLSEFGREVVAEMNRLGIMVDISHVSDETFEQVIELSNAPVIASHSSCRHFTPGFERNMSDEMIKRLAEHGGVIQINFGSAFLTEASNKTSMEAWKELEALVAERGIEDDPEAKEALTEEYQQEHPPVGSVLSDVADHIDHVVQLVGIDHVGLGSDFDGVSSVPEGLDDVSRYPNLIAELLRRGYSDEDVAKICGENLLRVWSEVERLAAERSSELATGS